LWDDARPLRPLWKLVGQVVIAASVVAGGLRVEFITHPLGEGFLNLGIFSWPFSVLWIVAMVNVLNFSDGLDGLAAGITAISSLTLLLAAAFTGASGWILLSAAALLGAAAGFLPWNFHPARIFMGDAGSLFLGYMLAAISIQGALKAPAALAILVPILVLGVPIFDTAWAILRRWQAGQPIGQADKGHVHHRLLGFGLTQRQTVLLLYCISAWLGLGSLALVYLPHVLALLILGLVAFSIYVMVSLVRVSPAVRSEEAGTWER
ncbi:MAG: MraY family glycosyltransferase, partial [Bacillota bacterium]|nr:MraY family glycosyltransferase [Bacillota bacterium]